MRNRISNFVARFALGATALFCVLGSLNAQESPGVLPWAPSSGETLTLASTFSQPAEVSTSTADNATPELGTGNFSRLPFRVSVSVREGYDDNVYTTKNNTVGSFYTNGNVVLDYKFGDARTQLALEAFGGLSYYYNRPFGQEYDITSGLSLTASHQVTPRLGLGAAVYLAYQSEPDFNNNFTSFGVNRVSGNYFFTSDKFSVSYQWTPRFSTVTSYTFGALHYDDSAIGSFEDRTEHTFGNEFRFLVLPTTTAVAEYRYQITAYDTAPSDSTTNFVLAGVDHSFNPRFKISLRGGAELRDYDTFGERNSPYGEATLNYALSEHSSLSWNNRYGLEEPNIAGPASRASFRTGLQATYAFTPRISSTLSIYYQHDTNESFLTPTFFSPAFNEDTVDFALGFRYQINRMFAALAGYDHTEVLSDITLREYSRNRVYLGLNATF